MTRVRVALALTAVLILAAACARHSRPLTALPLRSPAPVPGVAIEIQQLHDARGDIYARWSPLGRLPLVSLLYRDQTTCYPLAAGVLTSQTSVPAYTLTGHLPSDFPLLLRRLLQPGTRTSGPPAYTISGILHCTRLRQRANVVPLRLLALCGLPFSRTDFTLTIEITLRSAVPDSAPLVQRTYCRRASCTSGYYRNYSAAHALYVETLRTLLTEMATDISRMITRDRAA